MSLKSSQNLASQSNLKQVRDSREGVFEDSQIIYTSNVQNQMTHNSSMQQFATVSFLQKSNSNIPPKASKLDPSRKSTSSIQTSKPVSKQLATKT